MKIQIIEHPEKIVISINGDIDARDNNDFVKEIYSINDKYDSNIELDLSQMEFITSAFIGVLVNLKKFQIAKGKTVKIVKINPLIMNILERVHFVDYFNA
jgi:anti-anti-sigma factor